MRLSADAMIGLLLDAGRRLLWGTAAALFGVLLCSLTRVPHLPSAVVAALFVLAGISAWRPAPGLAAVVMLVPIASWLGRFWNGAVAWPEAVAMAFLAGYACRRALGRHEGSDSVLAIAIHTTIAVVVASVAVQILLLNWTIGFAALDGRLTEMVTTEYFVGQAGFEGTHAGMRLIEGLLLAHASASLAHATPAFAGLILRTAVVSAALASSLNLWRVWQGAGRTDSPLVTFFHYLTTIRFNTHYGDVNAAGSYFAMTLLAALGLAREASAWGWATLAGLISLSLILSGSRTAIAAAVTAAALVWWLKSRAGQERRVPLRRAAKVSAAIVVTVCMAAAYLLLARNDTPSSIALRIRAEFAGISLHMLSTRPAFGIGVGQFPARLQEFASPGLMAVYPKTQENAHNNFLQVLAELGIVGFVAFMWVLSVAAVSMLSLRKAALSPVQLHLSAGLLTFVLSWLGGHPLLVDAPAFTFWLLMGAAAGSAKTSAKTSVRVHMPRRTGLIAAAVVIATIASVPVRARQELGIANLEHMAIGLSRWQRGTDNVDYRMAGRASTVFVPSDAKVIALPLQSAQALGELRVDVYMDGRFVDALDIPSDVWRVLDLQVPRRDDGKRFRALELRIPGAATVDGQSLLRVGKLQPHW